MTEQQFLPGRKHAPVSLGKVLILGTGKSGRATAEYLLNHAINRVTSITIEAGESSDAALSWTRDFIAAHPNASFDVVFAGDVKGSGKEEVEAVVAKSRSAQNSGGVALSVSIVFDSEAVEGSYDLCVASPGISQFSDFYIHGKTASAEIISEVEFAWRESAEGARWVAITGTNGKTTTTALTAHLLQTAGLKASAVGNIGDACIEAVGAQNTDVYVAETSSYQLASTVFFAPDVAIVLNITPDHLAWHTSHEKYAEAKWKVIANWQNNPTMLAVLGAVNDEVRAKVRELKAAQSSDPTHSLAYVPLGTVKGLAGDMRLACGAQNAAFVTEANLLHVALNDKDVDLVAVEDLQIPGEHNIENALAASCAALALGVSPDDIRLGLKSFAPLEHRIEPAGTVDGVRFYNDSKATNVDATLVALKAFAPKRPIVLLGGRDKGTDLTPLVDACCTYVRGVVCYGESQERFLAAFTAPGVAERGLEVWQAAGMADALAEAYSHTQDGDIVLLSPACASFDEFSCYEERGDVFKELVATLAGRGAQTNSEGGVA